MIPKKYLPILVLVLLGSFWVGTFILFATTRNNSSSFEDKYNQQIETIDSLETVLIDLRVERDSLKKEAFKSDSIAKNFIDSIKSKFNDKEKQKLLIGIDNLDDSASFEYFSKWLSSGGSN